MVKGWDKFDEVKMGIVVRHIKRYRIIRLFLSTHSPLFPLSSALPDYVFDAGERQPKPAPKKRPKPAKVR